MSIRVNETATGWICLAMSLALSAGVFAQSTLPSGAYFSDTKTGMIGGTYAHIDPPTTAPFRVEPGASKALSPGCGEGGDAHGQLIARVLASGSLTLDFGETLPGHSETRPDVFRVVSLASDDRIVSFAPSGGIAAFVTEVRLGQGHSDDLAASSTGRVFMRVAVPKGTALGRYTGTLTVHVQGWSDDLRVPMVILVSEEVHGGGQCDGDSGNGGAGCTRDGVSPSPVPHGTSSAVSTEPPEASAPEQDARPAPEQDAGSVSDTVSTSCASETPGAEHDE